MNRNYKNELDELKSEIENKMQMPGKHSGEHAPNNFTYITEGHYAGNYPKRKPYYTHIGKIKIPKK